MFQNHAEMAFLAILNESKFAKNEEQTKIKRLENILRLINIRLEVRQNDNTKMCC